MRVPIDPQSFFFSSGKEKPLHEVDDALLLHSNKDAPRTQPEEPHFLGSGFSTRRAKLFLLFIGFLVLCVVGRMIQLQIIEGNTYLVRAEQNRQRVVPILAERGTIYDRNGIALTENIPNFSLTLRPQDLPRGATIEQTRELRREVIERLAELTDTPEEVLRETINEYGNYSYESIVIEEDLAYDTALGILIEASDLPGIGIQQGSKRRYVHEIVQGGVTTTVQSLGHVLGYMGKLTRKDLEALRDQGYIRADTIGKDGVELTYESLLRGEHGVRRIEVNARGAEQYVLAEEAPEPGLHVGLSLDANIQAALERALREELQVQEKERGAAVAIDPRSGAVLGLVSIPTYDNNDFSGGISQEDYSRYIEDENAPLFHRAISGAYPSGSTIKPIVAAMALHEGIITPRTTVLSTGGLAVGQWFFPDWLAGGHGRTNVRKSLADSVNTFYYIIGGGYRDRVGLGARTIANYLQEFGLGQRLGIDLPGEARGLVPTPEWKEKVKGEQWYIGDTYNLSIGQGDLLLSPLQLTVLTATIANGGFQYVPQLIVNTTDPVTGAVEEREPVLEREWSLGKEHLETVRAGMRDCVTVGSCRALARLGVSVAGKTGTAQWHNTKLPHAWFTSFAPYENPEIAVTFLIEEGEGGALAAVPAARRFYAWWQSYR